MKFGFQFDINYRIAKRYAKALFDLSLQETCLDPIEQELVTLRQWIRQSDELNRFLKNPEIAARKRLAILKTLWEGRLNPLFLRFILFLEHKNRLYLLDEICEVFENLYLEYKRIMKVKITSSQPLEKYQTQKILGKLQSRFQKGIRSFFDIDERIIGGLKVQVHELIYDFSLKTQIEKFKARVINV